MNKALFWLSLASLLFLPLSLAAQAPADFSDAEKQLVQWPFTVTDYFTDSDENNIFQHTRVAESPTMVYERLLQMRQDKTPLGDFVITSVATGAQPNFYNAALGYQTIRHFVTIEPFGTGAEIIVKSTPNALVSGYFKRVLYPYRLGDGQSVPVGRFDSMDE